MSSFGEKMHEIRNQKSSKNMATFKGFPRTFHQKFSNNMATFDGFPRIFHQKYKPCVPEEWASGVKNLTFIDRGSVDVNMQFLAARSR